MSNKWLSAGRYQITRGVFKRLWSKDSKLSVVMVPSIKRENVAPPIQQELLAEDGQTILAESGTEIILD